MPGLRMPDADVLPTLANYTSWRAERHFFDAEAEKTFTALERQLPGYQLIVQSSTDDEDRLVIAAFNDRTQGTRYLYDRPTNTLTKLGDVAPWLDPAQAAPMKAISSSATTANTGLSARNWSVSPWTAAASPDIRRPGLM